MMITDQPPGIWDLGLGTGDWETPNPQSPIPNPQSPIHRSSFIVHRSSFVTRHSSLAYAWLLLISALFLALAGCGTASDTTAPPEQTGAGDINPEAVAHNFFEDLGAALKDPALAREETRSYWVERLAGYFAPAERDDQRAELRDALASFADGLRQLGPDQTLTLDLHFEGVEKLSDDGTHALVRPINAHITLLIAHTTDRGQVTDYDQQIGLDKIIGRADGALPTVKIGERWFLTEG